MMLPPRRCRQRSLFLAASRQPARAGQGRHAPAPKDGLDLRFADGIVAIAEDKIITVDDVRREISPLIPQLQQRGPERGGVQRQAGAAAG